jgi:hypothetical protein
MSQICDYGCGQPALYSTKSSRSNGPFQGRPIHRCATSHHQCPAIQAKKVQTSLDRYGTEFPWQTEEIKQKKEATSLTKYGAKSSLLNPQIQEKRRLTMLAKYGVEQPTLNESIKLRAAAGIKQSYINDPGLAQRQVQSKKIKYGHDLESCVDKSRATQIANGRWVDPAKRTEWAQYKFRVKYLTAKIYKKHKHIINPDDLLIGRCEYQIDHIYSIRHGFENSVAPEVIASVHNLRVLWHVDNKSKHIRSDQTLEQLMEKIGH